MKLRIVTALLLCAAILLTACGVKRGGDPSENATAITPEQALERLQSGDPIVLLDVRRAEEYAEGHIEGAILLPNEDIGSTRPEQLPDLDAEIIVYCRTGRRSAQAAAKLVKLGYTKVYDLGGIVDWPYDVTTES